MLSTNNVIYVTIQREKSKSLSPQDENVRKQQSKLKEQEAPAQLLKPLQDTAEERALTVDDDAVLRSY
jgi:hypothetical protein